MSRCYLPLACFGLALSLSGCVSSSNPTDLIPVGLRATFGAEDRNNNPAKPMTAEQLLAKLRGEPTPAAPEPKAPPSVPASWNQQPVGAPSVQANQLPKRPTEAQATATKSEEPEGKPTLVEVLLRFEDAATAPRSEDGLRVQLAAGRASRLGGVAAMIRVGPSGTDKIASLALALKRGEAIRSLLPETLAKSAEVAYAPSIEPGSARFDLR
jgi:hypothetical protein